MAGTPEQDRPAAFQHQLVAALRELEFHSPAQ